MRDRQRARVIDVRERLTDRYVREAGDSDNLAGTGFIRLHALEHLGDVKFGDLHLFDGVVYTAPGDCLTAPDRSVEHPAQG